MQKRPLEGTERVDSWIKIELKILKNLEKLPKIWKIGQWAAMKIKVWTTKFNLIFISIFQILGSVGPVKQLPYQGYSRR